MNGLETTTVVASFIIFLLAIYYLLLCCTNRRKVLEFDDLDGDSIKERIGRACVMYIGCYVIVAIAMGLLICANMVEVKAQEEKENPHVKCHYCGKKKFSIKKHVCENCSSTRIAPPIQTVKKED